MEEREVKQHLDDFKFQLGRFASDWESEKDNRKHLTELVKTWNKIQEMQQQQLNRHEKILLNDGKNGIVMEVDRLVNEKKSSNESLYKWMAVISTLVSIVAVLITLRNNV